MGLSYEKNKKHIKKWKEENAEKYREYDRNYRREKYIPTLYYKYSTEVRRLMNIKI